MTLQDIVHRYRDRFIDRYGKTLTTAQWSALNAMGGCRQGQYGDIEWACTECHHHQNIMRSCGHRSCNQCQNNSTQDWLDRQQQKLLPVTYFMATFTLPRQLRELAKSNQQRVYNLLITTAVDTLKVFARNDKTLKGELGCCAVLHTHTRRLDYHPHVHIVVPGGAINKARREWRKVKNDYLFNGEALSRVFRGKFLRAITESGLKLPKTPKSWVVHCEKVGKGVEALRYLSRYLYRGVISNDNIIDDDGENITFRYKESDTLRTKIRTLPAEDFIHLLLQHCLPKGFRRARDYGFLHGNAKATLKLVQWVFRVSVPTPEPQRSRAKLPCPKCKSAMHFFAIGLPRPAPG